MFPLHGLFLLSDKYQLANIDYHKPGKKVQQIDRQAHGHFQSAAQRKSFFKACYALGEKDSYRNTCFIYIFPVSYTHILSPRISMSLNQAKCPPREESTIPGFRSLLLTTRLDGREGPSSSATREGQADLKEQCQKRKCRIIMLITNEYRIIVTSLRHGALTAY